MPRNDKRNFGDFVPQYEAHTKRGTCNFPFSVLNLYCLSGTDESVPYLQGVKVTVNAKPDEKNERFALLDALRGLSLVSMIIFHLCYDIFVIYGVNPSWSADLAVVAWERGICDSFILVSGACAALSKNGLRRGIFVNIAGFVVTAVTVLALPEQAVWFGILNLLGCAMMLVYAIRPVLDKIEPMWGVVGAFLLFAVFFGVPKGYVGFLEINLFNLPDELYSCEILAFLGLPSPNFTSSDYFPIVPWIFLYEVGFFLWRLCERHEFTQFFRAKIQPLSVMGKYSLWIYLAHQPVLMGAVFLCTLFVR